jgi:hypothetical protein
MRTTLRRARQGLKKNRAPSHLGIPFGKCPLQLQHQATSMNWGRKFGSRQGEQKGNLLS